MKTMTTGEQHDAGGAEIRRTVDAYHAAVIRARTDDLDRLLTREYSLVHITGYVHGRKNGWP
ncbi:MAG TPA: hypothetical protein VII75_15285 [Thermoanaerobaculia bacterium]|nr:hypothetical protein [Thermoanaerobaculia bacterium]